MIITKDELLKYDLCEKVIAIETDTVYGLGCLLNSKNAIKRIFDIKKRDVHKPLAVLVSNLNQVKDLIVNFDEYKEYFVKYWPGAITFICPKSKMVDYDITSNLETVGLRMPNDKKLLSIIEHFGPLVMTSLNISSEEPILKFKDALVFENKVDFLVKGNDLSNIPSTVYDLVNKKTLRKGSIDIK